jgi:hypothetical protein
LSAYPLKVIRYSTLQKDINKYALDPLSWASILEDKKVSGILGT